METYMENKVKYYSIEDAYISDRETLGQHSFYYYHYFILRMTEGGFLIQGSIGGLDYGKVTLYVKIWDNIKFFPVKKCFSDINDVLSIAEKELEILLNAISPKIKNPDSQKGYTPIHGIKDMLYWKESDIMFANKEECIRFLQKQEEINRKQYQNNI